ncbi:MAG: pectate lyase, partial [bacterium]|nr:pectate lyase [bacterium]
MITRLSFLVSLILSAFNPAGSLQGPMAASAYGQTSAAMKPLPDAIPAFPGAWGGGMFATGGRGGKVIAVVNLNDDGPGSLREAVETPGPRIVVFSVSGTIDLQSDLVIAHSNLTIAGQTASGDGICLKRFPLKISEANDVVVRFLRVRPGDESGRRHDGIEVRRAANVMIDHCSVSWSIDEGINTWHETKNLTVQWCLIAEALDRPFQSDPHGYGASWGGEDCSYHHNLLAHCAGRNPSIAGQERDRTINMDHRCSVIYNWRHRTCDGKPMQVNVVNNYYKPGPATKAHVRRRIARIDDTQSAYGYPSIWFIEGNTVEGAPGISADNWRGGVHFKGNASEAENRRRTPFPVRPVPTQSAAEAYVLVLRHGGANRPRRDPHDTRIVREVETGTPTFGNGIIDTPKQVGGWPELKSVAAPPDTDGDGMPDAWETAHMLNPHNTADG